MRYEDKVVVVTGGGKGIGFGCVKTFVEEGGSQVVFCARKTDEGEAVAAYESHNRQAVDLGHLEVEQGEIGVRSLDERDRLRAAGRFADELDALERAERCREERPRGSFIVRDHDSQHRGQPARAAALACSTGTRTSTVVPTPGALRIVIAAASP